MIPDFMIFLHKGAENKDGSGLSGRSILLNLGAFIALVIFLNTFIIRSYKVEGASMVPTLQDQDRLVVNKLPRSWARLTGNVYVPKRGDIIVFNHSNFSGGSSAQKQLIKRVVGLPGERVTVKNGFVTVYNTANPEGFDPDVLLGLKSQVSSASDPIDFSLSKNQIFVLGDNRTNSDDSRSLGPIQTDNIIGELAFRLLPLSEAQRF
jgi:signal peptidase I